MPRTHLTRPLRVAGVAAALGASLVLTGCGFDAQTLQPYTPAQGVNADVLDGPLVRNILVIANAAGKGQLSASLLSAKGDTLTSVSGTASKPDGSPASTLQVTGAPASGGVGAAAAFAPVALPAGELVVLTSPATPVFVSSADLKPGLDAKLMLTFSSGAQQTITVPVVDAANPIYASVAPTLQG